MMGKMTPGGPIQLSLVMLLALLRCPRGLSQSNRITYPPTPPYSSRLMPSVNPFDQSSPFPYALSSSSSNPMMMASTILPAGPGAAATTIPAGQGTAVSLRPVTPSRMTMQRTNQMLMSPSQTTDAADSLRTTLVPLIASGTTDFPVGATVPASTPQRVQMTFNNRYSDLGVNEYDVWGNRMAAQRQLSQACRITNDRITDVSTQPNATDYLVLRFSIQQGYPIYISEAVQLLQQKAHSPTFMQLTGQPLELSTMVFWTDDGPCPADGCMNGGLCNVTVTGSYECQCSPGYAGPSCQDAVRPANLSLLGLLVLLVIPIAAALFVGFYFGLRRQQKQRLKRAFDLRDVRTIGPKSMLSLPHEPGMRNEMYDTRSFALAFTDTSFSKSSPPPSSSEDDLMSRMG